MLNGAPCSYDVELPLDCDYDYWEGPQPFQQPEGQPSAMSYWIKFLELLKIMTLIHRNLVRETLIIVDLPDAQNVMLVSS